jgi:hypothetical protein
MAHEYQILVSINHGAQEPYEVMFATEEHMKRLLDRLNHFGSGTHQYTARVLRREVYA